MLKDGRHDADNKVIGRRVDAAVPEARVAQASDRPRDAVIVYARFVSLRIQRLLVTHAMQESLMMAFIQRHFLSPEGFDVLL